MPPRFGLFLNRLRILAIGMVIIGFSFNGGCKSSNKAFNSSLTSPSVSGTQFTNASQIPLTVRKRGSFDTTINHVDESCQEWIASETPLSTATELPSEYYDLSLDEALSEGLQNKTVLTGLGGRLLLSPDSAATTYDPAIITSDPVLGINAALAQFDATVNNSTQLQKNDSVFNNPILGSGAQESQQDLFSNRFSIAKTTAIGSRLGFRHFVQHDNNNAPGNLFSHAWNTSLEAEIRQPLLQGAGLDFNRIVGPNATPGFRFSTGLLIAHANSEIGKLQFELAMNEYIVEVISAYWQLYFAYRQFEAIKQARDSALEVWNTVNARFEQSLEGGQADKEAQAREQYYYFQGRLLTAINGDSTQGEIGVLKAEADLRHLIGWTTDRTVLLRPSDQPTNAITLFDWPSTVATALNNRPEIKQQAIRVQQRELELVASKNFLLPRLDTVGIVRNNGFGDDLMGSGPTRFSSAYQDLFSNDHVEWEFGIQYQRTLGTREARTAVKYAELRLARESAVLQEQKKQLIHELGTAIRQIEQANQSKALASVRVEAAEQAVRSRKIAYEAGNGSVYELLDAQQRLSEARISQFRSEIGSEIGTSSLHLGTGQLLEEFSIQICDDF